MGTLGVDDAAPADVLLSDGCDVDELIADVDLAAFHGLEVPGSVMLDLPGPFDGPCLAHENPVHLDLNLAPPRVERSAVDGACIG